MCVYQTWRIVCEGELAGVMCKLLTCKAVVEEVTLARVFVELITRVWLIYRV